MVMPAVKQLTSPGPDGFLTRRAWLLTLPQSRHHRDELTGVHTENQGSVPLAYLPKSLQKSVASTIAERIADRSRHSASSDGVGSLKLTPQPIYRDLMPNQLHRIDFPALRCYKESYHGNCGTHAGRIHTKHQLRMRSNAAKRQMTSWTVRLQCNRSVSAHAAPD